MTERLVWHEIVWFKLLKAPFVCRLIDDGSFVQSPVMALIPPFWLAKMALTTSGKNRRYADWLRIDFFLSGSCPLRLNSVRFHHQQQTKEIC